MEKSLLLLLLLCCLLLPAGSSLLRLYPSIRYGRHADAIFTNSYRKVLGQISARKFLQTVIGKRLQGENNSYVKRQSGVFEGTYKEDLTSIQTDEQYKAVHKHVLRHPTLP